MKEKPKYYKFKKGDKVIIYRNDTILSEEGNVNHYPLNKILTVSGYYGQYANLYDVEEGDYGIYEDDLEFVTKLHKAMQ